VIDPMDRSTLKIKIETALKLWSYLASASSFWRNKKAMKYIVHAIEIFRDMIAGIICVLLNAKFDLTFRKPEISNA